MIGITPLLSGLILLAGGLYVGRQGSARAARLWGIRWAGAALVFQVLSFLFLPNKIPLVLPGGIEFVLAMPRQIRSVLGVHGVLAMAIVALSPLRSHSVRSFSRMLYILAIGSAFLVTNDALVLAFLWALSALVMWRALSPLESSAHLFLIYQLPSICFFSAGAWLSLEGRHEWSVVCILCAVLLREAILPFHSWFLRLVEEAPLGLLCAFAAPQLGVYASLELIHGSQHGHLITLIGDMGAVSALIAALLALAQTSILRSTAYLLISQTSLISFGLANGTELGRGGAVLAWATLSLASSGFVLAIASVRARRGELYFSSSSAHPEQLPRLGTFLLLLGLTTVGLPLSAGFVAEDLLVQGSVNEHPYLGYILIAVTAINGLTVLRTYFALFAAGPRRPGEEDVHGMEALAYTVLLGALFLLGLLPGVVLG